jgi:alpha-1,2-mannosyltransferase
MDAIPVSPIRIGHRWFWIGLVILLAVVSGQYVHKAINNRSAFLRWREQVLVIDGGVDIYQRFQYPNPPIMALMLRPLAAIEPPVAGALIWFAIKVCLAALSFAAIFRLIEDGGLTFPPWARGLAILLSIGPIIGDLTHGNINILILFLVIAALYAFHRQFDILCGVWLALAICCKVTPLLFVPYFLWKRQWRVLFGVAAGMVLFLAVIPGAALGWRENQEQLNSWAKQMVVPFLRDGIVSSERPNQSLPGVATRLLTHSPSVSDYPNGVYTPVEYDNFADIGREGVRWLVRLCQGLFALMVILLCRTPARDRGGWRLTCEFAIILVGMLVFSERTWKHHCVTLAMPFAVLSYALATMSLSRGVKAALIAALAAATGLMLSASGLTGSRGSEIAQIYGVYLWALLVLLTALIVLLAGNQGERRSMIQAPLTSR